MHLAVAELRYLVVEQDTVSGEGEAEVLARVLLYGARVGDEVLYDLPVHERFAAEEVHLEVPARAGVLDEEVERPPAVLEGHERPLTVVLALTGEAVGAVEVAGVGDVEAEGLYHLRALLVLACELFVVVGGEELVRCLERGDVVEAFEHILARDLGVLCAYRGADLVRCAGLVHFNDVIGDVVHEVDRAGGGIEDDVVAV